MTENEVIFWSIAIVIACITIPCIIFISGVIGIKRKKLEIEEMKVKIEEMKVKKELGIDCIAYSPGSWVTKTVTKYGDNHEQQTTSKTTA